jgi:hypothetical protein
MLTHRKPTPDFSSNKASAQLSRLRTSHVDSNQTGATRNTTSSHQLMTRLEIIIPSILILIGDEQGPVTPQTGSWAYPDSFSIGTGGSFPGDEAAVP